MPVCPACSKDVESGSFCSACGHALEPPDDSKSAATTLGLTGAAASRDARPDHDSQPSDHGQYLPGTLISGRYRIVSLLGRGGMGQVYRADDLKLGHPVALKFLPPELANDARQLELLHNEVRLARQISHPNVCRVYDIGEANNQTFLTMEYVDGEDLRALLRRIGRLPNKKGIDVARQICRGLAAAHHKGVLHRDLKPANIMIDSRGQVRISDFGLARSAENPGDNRLEGTPAYMAPEQLTHGETSVRTDLYSCGLIFFELFTGKRVFQSNSVSELIREHEKSLPPSPSSVVDDIDSRVEELILQCIEKDPTSRPLTANALATALPGASSLDSILAAGETPSPQMLADAGETGRVSPLLARSAIVAIVLLMIIVVVIGSRFKLQSQTPPGLPPEALAVQARSILADLNHSDEPFDRTWGYAYDRGLIGYWRGEDDRSDKWEHLAAHSPSPIYFWYRESPRYLTNSSFMGFAPTESTPTMTVPRMAMVRLDPNGRLRGLTVIPWRKHGGVPGDPEPVDADWKKLFEHSGLNFESFEPSSPIWAPLIDSDLRLAWSSASAGTGESPPPSAAGIHVEARSLDNRINYFEPTYAWTSTGLTGEGPRLSIENLLFLAVLLVSLGSAVYFARQNLRIGRGDRRGAFRLASFWFIINLLIWLFGSPHMLSTAEFTGLFKAAAWGLLTGSMVWLGYVALEPHARRLWPNALIAWSRLLTGRLRDPMIGRDVLIGAILGLGISSLGYLIDFARLMVEGQAIEPRAATVGGFNHGALEALTSVPRAISFYLFLPQIAAGNALAVMMLLVLFRAVFRLRWIALTIMFLLIAVIGGLVSGAPYPWALLFGVAQASLMVFAVARFGILALVFTICFHQFDSFNVLTSDLTAWYTGRGLLLFAALIAIAIYGFVVSQGGKRTVGESLASSTTSGAA